MDVKQKLTLFKERCCLFSHLAHIFLAHKPTCGRYWEEKGNIRVPSRVSQGRAGYRWSVERERRGGISKLPLRSMEGFFEGRHLFTL